MNSLGFIHVGYHAKISGRMLCKAQMQDKSTSDKPLKMMPKPVISFPGRMGKIVKGYTLRVMQWNIDFNSDNVFSRTSHLIEIIGKEKPDVIFMQEVSAVETGPRGSSFHLLKSRLVDTGIYALFADDLIVERHPFYFAMTLIRKRILTKVDPEYIRFQRTKMARHLIVLRAGLLTESGEHEVCLLNSHFESLPSGTADRIDQFQEVLKIMRNEPRPSVFGGDTNLRAREIRLGDVRLPEEEDVVVPEGEFDVKVSDAWAQAGAESATKFSWDARVNDNKEWLGETRPYARFDRLFSSPGRTPDLYRPRAMSYRFVGKKRGQTDQFPSDHFGLVADYNMTLPS
ncbi:hypothetical protein NDN08_006560 [Rhodosorus marinus]|uniref:Endonuclease/exonuclease/phosphatase domain-containing protein n=1 Tax=Rhodosorus marinus TaxID=101924 RepID=A0AAV8ULX1_9RHOD|nr:hypothetical protein NDN08_006560 [Rhodosorus marinus]